LGVIPAVLAKDSQQADHPWGISTWPPPEMTRAMNLKQQEAEDLICDGATTFHGYHEHTPQGHRRFYAVVRTELNNDTDQSRSEEQLTTCMSATLTGPPDPLKPWETLEQPSLMSCFGDVPGSITLNYWLGISSSYQPAVEYKSNAEPRKVGLLWLLERIQSLEFGLEPDVSMHLFLNPEFTFDADLSWTASTQVYTRTSYTIPRRRPALTTP